MKTVGEILKAERQKQKLELSDIADKTKIGLAKLESIERGDYEALPAKVFTRGLIKSYAKQLHLDVEAIIALFETEYGGEEEVEETFVQPAPESSEEKEEQQAALFLFQAPKSFFLLLGFAVTAVLCVFIYITLQKISSYEEEEVSFSSELSQVDQLPVEKKPEPTPEPVEEKVEKVVEKTKTPEKKVKKVTPPPVKKKAEVDNKAEQKTALKKIAQLEKQKAVEKKEPVQPTTTSLPDQRLTVEAFEPTRLEIFWSSEKPQVMLLKADESKTFVFNKPIKIHLSDGGVVNITLNGKDLGVPGQIRNPIELNYP